MHRIAGIGALGVAAVIGGCGAGAMTLASYTTNEAITEYQVDATLRGDRLSVVETLDDDFGANSRHGFRRELDTGVVDRPGESLDLQNVQVESETANDDVDITPGYQTTTVRVGNENKTYQGEHRYQLRYDLVGVPDPQEQKRLVFIAVGDRWEIPIHDVTVRVAPDFEPGDVTCSLGGSGAFVSCDVSVQDGIVTATVPDVEPGQGVALNIGAGPARTPASLTPPPLDIPASEQPWVGAALSVGGAAAAAGAVGSLVAGRWVRRAGADRSGAAANPAEAAYATATDPDEGVKVSDAEAAEQVTIQFAPPEGLAPAQGAVLLRERVDNPAKTAWMAQAVIDGWATLEGDPSKPTIVRAARADQEPANMPEPLAAAFNGRQEIQLGTYDSSFAAGWSAIGSQLQSWRSWSGLWDNRRGTRNRVLAVVMLLVGVAAAGITGLALVAGLGRHVGVAVPIAVVTGLLFGFGVRAVFGAPTLAVRSPAGFGLWLRTEGFRRFLAESEGEHARWAADHGLLREYSAWAVALGELDRWNRAAAAAGIPPDDPGMTTAYAFAGMAAFAHTTSTAPSSSGGSSGFSGGGFSGGVGGGGGGNW